MRSSPWGFPLKLRKAIVRGEERGNVSRKRSPSAAGARSGTSQGVLDTVVCGAVLGGPEAFHKSSSHSSAVLPNCCAAQSQNGAGERAFRH